MEEFLKETEHLAAEQLLKIKSEVRPCSALKKKS